MWKRASSNNARVPVAESPPVNCSEEREIDGGAGDNGDADTESRREFAGHGKDSSTLCPALSETRPPSGNSNASAANRSRSRAISTANSRRWSMLWTEQARLASVVSGETESLWSYRNETKEKHDRTLLLDSPNPRRTWSKSTSPSRRPAIDTWEWRSGRRTQRASPLIL